MIKLDSALYVPTGTLPTNIIDEIKESLTLDNPAYASTKRFSKYAVSKTIPEFTEFYIEDTKGIWLPRNYDLGEEYDYLYARMQDNRVHGKDCEINFTGTLRNYQVDFFDGVDMAYDDLIFAAPCAHGKTSMSIYYASLIKKKTLILVPTHKLVKQWKKRIKYFTGQEVYDFSGSEHIEKIDASTMHNHNFFITTLETISLIFEKPKLIAAYTDFLIDIGLTVIDECHRTGAETLHPILFKIPSKKRLALTATFRRSDGREVVLKVHFGKMYKLENQFAPAEFYAMDTGIKIGKLVPTDKLKGDNFNWLCELLLDYEIPYEVTPRYINVYSDDYFQNDKELKELLKNTTIKWPKGVKSLLSKDTVFAQLDNFVTEHSGRVKILQTVINKVLEAGRFPLIISKRKKILQTLSALYTSKGIVNTLIISETANETEDDEMIPGSRLVFGIDKITEEGYDNDVLDTLIFVHPKKDTEQAIGRIQRELPGKKPAKVILLLDNCRSYLSIYQNSHTFVQINAILKPVIKPGMLSGIL